MEGVDTHEEAMSAAIAQHLNVEEKLILEIQVWAKVLWVRVQGLRPRFVSKEANMNNYQKLETYLIKQGTEEASAKKAASFVIGKAWEFESWEYVAPKFAPRHHDYVRQVFEAEKASQTAKEKEAEEMEREEGNDTGEGLNAYCDSPVNGSPKQVSWVRSIRGYAIESWLAPAVSSGGMTFENAVSILKNPDAKYWIDNRKEWGMR